MRVSWLVALCLALLPSAALARPYAVDDMLALESYGQVVIDPSERWAVIEHRRPWTSAASYNFGFRTVWLTARLQLVDLDAPGPPEPLFEQEDDAGYWSAGFSPSGRQMAVYRLTSDRLSLGVVDMATRTVRWLAIAPELPVSDLRPLWVDDDQLIYAARPSGALPRTITTGLAQARTAEGFSQARAGREPSLTLYGAGRYRDIATDYAAGAIVRADLRTGTLETLLSGPVADLTLAPGGKHLAVAERGEAVQPDPDRPVMATFQPRRLRLAIIDLGTGDVRRPSPDHDLLPFLLSWSPNGRELVYFARTDDADWEDGHLLRLPAAAGASLPAAPDLALDINAVGAGMAFGVDWLDHELVVRARSRGTGGPARWYRLTEDGPAPLGGPEGAEPLTLSAQATLWNSGGFLVRSPREGGHERGQRILSTGLAVQDIHQTGARETFNPDRRDPAPIILEGGQGDAVLALHDPVTGDVLWSAPLPRQSRLLAIARRGAAISLTTDRNGVGRLALTRRDRPELVLARINVHLADITPVERIAIQAPGPDGGMLTHWLSLPAGSGPDMPLVVMPYPGMVRRDGTPLPIDFARFHATMNPALLTGAGFAVLEPSIPMIAQDDAEIVQSASGEGSFAMQLRPADEDPSIRLSATVLAAIDAAAGTGRVSGTDIAVYGQSYGGWAALMLATQTDRFRAVVAAAGPYDYFAPYGFISSESDHHELGLSAALAFSFSEHGAGNVGGPPWRVPQRYLLHSPLYAAERITSPVLLIHGDVDFMPFSSAARMLMAMHRLDRDAILLRYGGEGHVLASPANIRDQWQRTFDFLRRHLDSPPGLQSPQ